MPWTVETLNAVVDKELDNLSLEMRAHFTRVAHLIKEFGLSTMREPHVKHLQGPLWEIRLTGRDGIARAVYITSSGQRVVILRVFVKKTQKTPQREIAIALARAKEVRP